MLVIRCSSSPAVLYLFVLNVLNMLYGNVIAIFTLYLHYVYIYVYYIYIYIYIHLYMGN